MKDVHTFETFKATRMLRYSYTDPLTDTDDAWHIDQLTETTFMFLWEGTIYEGTLEEMEKKLFELASVEPSLGEQLGTSTFKL